jgi:hypothetical protein
MKILVWNCPAAWRHQKSTICLSRYGPQKAHSRRHLTTAESPSSQLGYYMYYIIFSEGNSNWGCALKFGCHRAFVNKFDWKFWEFLGDQSFSSKNSYLSGWNFRGNKVFRKNLKKKKKKVGCKREVSSRSKRAAPVRGPWRKTINAGCKLTDYAVGVAPITFPTITVGMLTWPTHSDQKTGWRKIFMHSTSSNLLIKEANSSS